MNRKEKKYLKHFSVKCYNSLPLFTLYDIFQIFFFDNFLLFLTKGYELYIKRIWMLTSFAGSVLSLKMEYNQSKKWNLV